MSFEVNEGARILVNGQEIRENQAETSDGQLRFVIVPEDGYQIESVVVEGLGVANMIGKETEYLLTGIADDQSVVHITMEQTEEEPKTDFVYQDSRVYVTAKADKEANLPQNAEIKADYLAPGSQRFLDAEQKVRSAYQIPEDVELNIAPYDIYFVADGEKIEPEEGRVKVNITFLDPVEADASENEAVSVTETGVAHIKDGGMIERLDGYVQTTEDGDIHSANFTTDSFSVFVPFFVVRKAAGAYDESADLSNYTVGAVVVSPEGKYTIKKDGTYQLQTGVTYGVELSFKETMNLQFVNTGDMTIKLPQQFQAVDASGTFEVTTDSGNLVSGNEYYVDEGNILHVFWNKDDPNYGELIASGGASFQVSMEGDFDAGSDTLDFGNGVTLPVDVNGDVDISIKKDGYVGEYNAADNTYSVFYTLELTSTGENDNVKVTDSVIGDALNYKQGSFYAVKNSWSDSDSSIGLTPVDESDGGFIVTIPHMEHNETIYVKYTGIVDVSKLTVNEDGSLGIKDDTKNTVTAVIPNPDNLDGDPLATDSAEKEFENIVPKPSLSKSGVVDAVDAYTADVIWTIRLPRRSPRRTAMAALFLQEKQLRIRSKRMTTIRCPIPAAGSL